MLLWRLGFFKRRTAADENGIAAHLKQGLRKLGAGCSGSLARCSLQPHWFWTWQALQHLLGALQPAASLFLAEKQGVRCSPLLPTLIPHFGSFRILFLLFLVFYLHKQQKHNKTLIKMLKKSKTKHLRIKTDKITISLAVYSVFNTFFFFFFFWGSDFMNWLNRWLKHNSLSYPQIAKLICMTKGNLESISRVAEWLKTVHVKGRFIGLVMLKAGEKLFKCTNKESDEIVEYLERNGIRREWMGYVFSRCPLLLSYTMEEVESHVRFFLDMGMNEKDFGTMVFDYPRVLGYYSLIEMNEKVVHSLCLFLLPIMLAIVPTN